MIFWGSLAAAALLAGIHLSNVLRLLDGIPRSRFLSVAAGVSVAFVFLPLLPALESGQAAVERAAADGWLAELDRHVYAVALGSLVLFYAPQPARVTARRSVCSGCTWGPSAS